MSLSIVAVRPITAGRTHISSSAPHALPLVLWAHTAHPLHLMHFHFYYGRTQLIRYTSCTSTFTMGAHSSSAAPHALPLLLWAHTAHPLHLIHFHLCYEMTSNLLRILFPSLPSHKNFGAESRQFYGKNCFISWDMYANVIFTLWHYIEISCNRNINCIRNF